MAAKYWVGEVPEKDAFGDPIKAIFIDGRTKHGLWAIMSTASWELHGTGLGEGKGQRYLKTPKGWLKVEG